jgi:hypothetical protein
MKSIRRNAKQLPEIVRSARAVKVFSLENGFVGNPYKFSKEIYSPTIQVEKIFKDNPNGSLKYEGGGVYHYRVHSNLWYEFESIFI